MSYMKAKHKAEEPQSFTFIDLSFKKKKKKKEACSNKSIKTLLNHYTDVKMRGKKHHHK